MCDQESGQCPCQDNFGGRQCDTCTTGYYDFPNCFRCGCDSMGSKRMSCSDAGICDCKENFIGEKCDQCGAERFNYPLCEACTCNPDGVTDNFFAMGGCASVPAGELCDCKEAVTGRTCDSCKELHWNLRAGNPAGCQECDCHRAGTLGTLGSCGQQDGQCGCKAAVRGLQCTDCRPGWFGLSVNSLLGCAECGCDQGGAADPTCDPESGQCECRPGLVGRQCDAVQDLHYLPGLYQLQREIEDGYRADGSPVRFDYKQSRFPGFSWRGYAGFSPLQEEVLQDVSIVRASTYNTVLRYHNPNPFQIKGRVTISQQGGQDPSPASHDVILDPTSPDQPGSVIVSGELNLFPAPYDLQPGEYTVSVVVDNKAADSQEVLVDYFVLLPDEFVKPRILRESLQESCRRGEQSQHCRQEQIINIKSLKAQDLVLV